MTTGVHLIGGGWDAAVAPSVYGPFLAQAGGNPEVACLVIDEGDGETQFDRWAAALSAVATCRPVPVLVPLGQILDPGGLAGADALLVCGGLTPAYAAAVAPVSSQLRAWLADRPYCGFSAGASIAATAAVTGGWRWDGRPIIGEDAAEDLDEVTVVPGLGLVPFTVEVHAAQWGTLPRLLAAVGRSGHPGLAIDENTVVSVVGGVISVVGLGYVHLATVGDGAVTVRRFADGARIPSF